MFGALKRGFRSMAYLILVVNVVGELRPKRTLAASRGFLAAARLPCFILGRGFALSQASPHCIISKTKLKINTSPIFSICVIAYLQCIRIELFG